MSISLIQKPEAKISALRGTGSLGPDLRGAVPAAIRLTSR